MGPTDQQLSKNTNLVAKISQQWESLHTHTLAVWVKEEDFGNAWPDTKMQKPVFYNDYYLHDGVGASPIIQMSIVNIWIKIRRSFQVW